MLDRLPGITERLMPVGVPYAPAQRIRQRSLERAVVATAQEKLVSLVACCNYLEHLPTALFENPKRSMQSGLSAAMLRDGGSLRMLEYFSEI